MKSHRSVETHSGGAISVLVSVWQCGQQNGIPMIAICSCCGMESSVIELWNETDEEEALFYECSWLSVCCHCPVKLCFVPAELSGSVLAEGGLRRDNETLQDTARGFDYVEAELRQVATKAMQKAVDDDVSRLMKEGTLA